MRILAIDPSSTATGYAFMESPHRIIDAGLLLPKRTRDDANARIMTMVNDLSELITGSCVVKVIIEDTSGKVGARGRMRGMNGAGLAIHGKAIGWFAAKCMQWCGPDYVELVPENVWTRGVTKGRRQQAVAAIYPNYDPAKDPGGDVADAIALGRWWLVEQSLRIAAPPLVAEGSHE